MDCLGICNELLLDLTQCLSFSDGNYGVNLKSAVFLLFVLASIEFAHCLREEEKKKKRASLEITPIYVELSNVKTNYYNL